MPTALLVAGTVFGVAQWLLTGLPSMPTGPAVTTARSEVIQTALAAGAGVGAAITVMLAFRRQRHQELTAHVTAYLAEHAAADSRHDATERRVTELYIKAVEQLGSDKAVVRLGGLYALQRLAQDNPDHRQTIVNVICAYLRMPYTLPHAITALLAPAEASAAEFLSNEASGDDTDSGKVLELDREGELQVRMAAQRILAEHLRNDRSAVEKDSMQPGQRFWPGIRLDLTGATLVDFEFDHCHVAGASFYRTSFLGDTWFREATFAGNVWFHKATFAGLADFSGAVFAGRALFGSVAFAGDVGFGRAIFTGDVWFEGAAFAGDSTFEDAVFNENPELGGILVTGAGRHVWPEGWRVRVEPDGTRRLQCTSPADREPVVTEQEDVSADDRNMCEP
ncbi:pentapeptide repeat-containing protein [Microbispora sp. KK1-11]|uniref:pentapeptide repeat-containing protein n=1 Tax=Microbispora sp. KK1-11 TaxID=2053005 RepID=UPI001C8E26BA|nr:pentapeptide repeat-containing protein [Microbispora sp. KK1-11]